MKEWPDLWGRLRWSILGAGEMLRCVFIGKLHLSFTRHGVLGNSWSHIHRTNILRLLCLPFLHSELALALSLSISN